ncbi:MAG: hypothetical protein A2Z37_12765 [Chloroflexi bacterium RBG_19FT_COMBO_62_14]|nr:MAG: hypothetical protein A2Z37_12765 [Chloroflexi bacterium RBG_19FT_COMBO_62_14]
MRLHRRITAHPRDWRPRRRTRSPIRLVVPLPAAVQAVALAVCSLGYALVVWATASNAFFSLIVRTALEDLTLQAERPGYPGYVPRVRQRLVPGLW